MISLTKIAMWASAFSYANRPLLGGSIVLDAAVEMSKWGDVESAFRGKEKLHVETFGKRMT